MCFVNFKLKTSFFGGLISGGRSTCHTSTSISSLIRIFICWCVFSATQTVESCESRCYFGSLLLSKKPPWTEVVFLFSSSSRFFLSVEHLIKDGFASLSRLHLNANARLHFSATVPLQYSWLLFWLNRSRARQTAIWEKREEVTWSRKPSLKAGDGNTDIQECFCVFFCEWTCNHKH